MQDRLIRLPVFALAIAALACGMLGSPAATPALPSPAASPSPQPTSPTPASTAFEAVIAMLGPKGEVSPEMALQAFALAVSPLPGVTPPAGEPGQLDADAAVAWVFQVWDQLSPEQQTAITDALAFMPDPYSSARTSAASAPGLTLAAWQPASFGASPDCGTFVTDPTVNPVYVPVPPSPAVQPYVDMVKAAYEAIAGNLGRRSVPDMAVCLIPGEILSANALARPFDAEHAQLGLPVTCSIHLNADTIGDIEAAGQLGYLIAYETFACFAVTANPDETISEFAARAMPSWVRGGTSAWAAATVAAELFGGAGDVLDKPWNGYLIEPHLSLFQRTNSAIGFFAQLEGDADGPSVWNLLDQTLTAADTVSAFEAATGGRQSFIDLWAAGYFRDVTLGADWDIVGPGITDDTAESASLEIANGENDTLIAPALAVAIGDLSTSADVTTLAGDHLRVHDGVQDLTEIGSRSFCTRPGGSSECVCPKDTPGAKLPPLQSLNADVKLALAGMETGGAATIQGLSLDDYCGSPAPTAQPASGPWSMVFWSPPESTPVIPLLMAYTCDGLVSTWKAIYLAMIEFWERPFDLPFADGLVVHRDFHYDIPGSYQTVDKDLDYAVDFTLDPNSNPPVIIVTGTKIGSNDGGGGEQVYHRGPIEFGAEAPLELKNVSLETQMKPYPEYQHPFRTQALAECGQ